MDSTGNVAKALLRPYKDVTISSELVGLKVTKSQKKNLSLFPFSKTWFKSLSFNFSS